jgi:hypothetical protein
VPELISARARPIVDPFPHPPFVQTEFEMALLKQSLQAAGIETDADAMASPTELIAFSESVVAALKVLRYMVTDLKDFLPHSQDTGPSSSLRAARPADEELTF